MIPYDPMLNFDRAKHYALDRLEQELSPNLHYHSVRHTRDDVAPAVERLAGIEGVTGESLILLLTAAWFHDLGYVEQREYHELISARIAVQTLPGFGYADEQIEVIQWAILATVLPQSPRNLLEQILADADLDVLGRDDLLDRNNDLRMELVHFGEEFTDEEWCRREIKFLESHAYFTSSARSLRDPGKVQNVARLNDKLQALTRQSD